MTDRLRLIMGRLEDAEMDLVELQQEAVGLHNYAEARKIKSAKRMLRQAQEKVRRMM